MKKMRYATFAAVLLVAGAVTTLAKEGPVAPEVLKIGASAPAMDVAMKNVDGKMTTIGKVKGEKGTLVVFWCNHCPYVVAWESRMVKLANEYRKKGIGVIFVNSNDPARKAGDGFEPMQRKAKEKGYEAPYVVDATSGVARAFGAARTPECFLFDAKMKLVYHGAVDDNSRSPDNVTKRYLADALAALVAGETIAVKETKAPGCSIKWRPKPTPPAE